MASISYEFLQLLRVMLQDQDRVDFTDERLKELIATAARLVIQEVDFDTAYTVSILQRTIDPDPIAVPDDSFVNLVALKAACILDTGTLRTEALKSGVKIVQEKTSIETGNRIAGFKEVMSMGWCKAYAMAKEEYESNDNVIAGHAIMSPMRTIDGFPSSDGGGHSYMSDPRMRDY
jgi:hypothetical protein